MPRQEKIGYSASQEWSTEERETVSWEMEKEGTETTKGERNGRNTEETATTTATTESEQSDSDHQEMNVEEDWHISETPTQLGMP